MGQGTRCGVKFTKPMLRPILYKYLARKAEWKYALKLKLGKEHTKTITFKVNMSNSDQNPYRNLQQNVSDAFKDLQGISYWNEYLKNYILI